MRWQAEKHLSFGIWFQLILEVWWYLCVFLTRTACLRNYIQSFAFYVSTDFTYSLQGYFTGRGVIIALPQCKQNNLMNMGKCSMPLNQDQWYKHKRQSITILHMLWFSSTDNLAMHQQARWCRSSPSIFQRSVSKWLQALKSKGS